VKKLFKRKGFIWNLIEKYSLDEMEFTEAISNFEDMTAEYDQYETFEMPEGEGVEED